MSLKEENASYVDNDKIAKCILKYQKSNNSKTKKELIDFVFLTYTPFMKNIVHSFARRYTDPFDDLFQVATIGLIKSMESFKPNLNTVFKTYATHMIIGEIKHYLRDKASLIRIPRHIQELSYRIYKITKEYEEKFGKEPSNGEIVERMKISNKKIDEATGIERRTTPISIDLILENDKSFLEDAINKPAIETYQRLLTDLENKITLKDALLKLDEQSIKIINMSFFEEKNNTQIANELEISQTTVARKIKLALEQLYKTITNEGKEEI